MKFLHAINIIFAFLSFLIFAQNAHATYDRRGMARFSIGLESGISYDKLATNYQSDNLVTIEGIEHTSLSEGSWEDVNLWKNKINLTIPLFKVGSGDLILQGFGALGDSFSGEYQITQRYDPVDKEAAGYEYRYRNYNYGDIDFKSYDFSINLAYQMAITPDGRKNRDYYVFNSKVHSFLLPKIGYSSFKQDHSVSSSFDTFDFTDSYTSNWRGPFIGVDSVNYLSDNHKVSFGGNFYYISYDSSADIRSDEAFNDRFGGGGTLFDSFLLRSNDSIKSDATGSGYSFDLRYSYQPGNHISYDINANYTSTRIKGGDETNYYRDGSTTTEKINEADWESFLLSLGITYNF